MLSAENHATIEFCFVQGNYVFSIELFSSCMLHTVMILVYYNLPFAKGQTMLDVEKKTIVNSVHTNTSVCCWPVPTVSS